MANSLNSFLIQTLGRDIPPSIGFNKNNKAKVITAQFGEGYSQRTTTFLNNITREWTLTFTNQSLAVISRLEEFISGGGTVVYTGIYPSATLTTASDKSKQGVSYFLWTPVDDTITYKVLCSEYTIEYTSVFSATLSCKFTQVYDI